nr:Tn3 family transposase [Nitrosospira multiformis]
MWNTTYLQRAVDYLRKQRHHPVPGDLTHLSPLGWGDYHGGPQFTLGAHYHFRFYYQGKSMTARSHQN